MTKYDAKETSFLSSGSGSALQERSEMVQMLSHTLIKYLLDVLLEFKFCCVRLFSSIFVVRCNIVQVVIQ